MNDEYWGLAKFASGGGGFAAVLLFGRWLVNWLTGRHDRREARLDAKSQEVDQRWASYTKRTEERCEGLETRLAVAEAEVDQCHKDKRALEGRVSALEGFANGMGDRRQESQLIRSLEQRVQQIEQGEKE